MNIDLLRIPGITIIRGVIVLACIIVGLSVFLATGNGPLFALFVDPIPLGLIAVGTYEEIKDRRVLPF